MPERATVNYWKDARVGDLVWFRDGNKRYNRAGEYRGSGFFELKPVVAISRKYMTVGTDDFDKTTGHPRTVKDFRPPQDIFGEIEKWVEENEINIRRALDTRDPMTLLRVARALGMEVPEDVT